MIGLRFPGSERLPDLGSKITVPLVQSFGNIAEVIEVQYIQHNIWGTLFITVYQQSV